MSERPFWPFPGGDFYASTMHLTKPQREVYQRLLWHYWCHGGLPDDDHQLARIADWSLKQWCRNRDIYVHFFGTKKSSGSDVWRHEGLDAQLAKAAEFREKQRQNANQRWAKNSQKNNNDDAMASSEPMPFIFKKEDTLTSVKMPRAGRPQQVSPPDRKLRSSTPPAPNGTNRKRLAARQAWEAGLTGAFRTPDEHALAIDALAANPRIVDRITDAELRQPGQGVAAALKALAEMSTTTTTH